MSKIITFLFVVLVLGYVVFLNSLKNYDSLNPINRRFRPWFVKTKLTRQLFFLNKPGDLRFEYLAKDKSKILVEIDFQKDKVPSSNLNDWLERLFTEVLNKKVEVKIGQEEELPGLVAFSDNQLRKYEKSLRALVPNQGEAYLHVLYVSSSYDAPSNTGLVLNQDSLFIFKDAINTLSERENIRDRIEESTLRHEFGHLLGLEHTARENCVMSESVEVYGNRRRQFENIPIDYCQESLEKIERI